MNPNLLSDNLFEEALLAPLRRHPGARLCVVSGYASAAMASRHILAAKACALPLSVDLVYGMATSDGVSLPNHQGFLSLQGKREFSFDGAFACAYVRKPHAIHSKVYVWCHDDTPYEAFIGSANYTEAGFGARNTRHEVLAPCAPASALDYFWHAKALATSCAESQSPLPSFRSGRSIDIAPNGVSPITLETDPASPFCGHLRVEVSLLTRSGETGYGSRLNWGIRPNGTKRNPDQAYIGLNGAIRESDFFPEVAHRFTLLTDDGHIFTCVRAQAGGKAIHTPQDNAELGRYFRQRLGLPSGHYITLTDLNRYGRTSVTFYKLDEENFAMDFSKPIS